MITVLVVDDQSLIRQAVTDILTGEDGIEVAGEALNGRQAVRLARELTPDVIVMDIRMPELDGIGATAEICADPNLAVTKVLILTTFEEDENLIAALRAGASGFVGKGAEPEEIVRTPGTHCSPRQRPATSSTGSSASHPGSSSSFRN